MQYLTAFLVLQSSLTGTQSSLCNIWISYGSLYSAPDLSHAHVLKSSSPSDAYDQNPVLRNCHHSPPSHQSPVIYREMRMAALCCNASGGKIKSKEPKQAGCTNEWGNEENREVHLRDLTYPLNLYLAEGNTETNERIQRGREREWGWERQYITLTQGQRERKVRLTAVKAKRLMKIMI